MYSNLIQLTSGTLLKKIKVTAGQLGLGKDTFSSIWDIFFCKNQMCIFNLGHMSYLFKMLTEQDIIGYLHTPTTMQVIEKGFRLNDIKV